MKDSLVSHRYYKFSVSTGALMIAAVLSSTGAWAAGRKPHVDPTPVATATPAPTLDASTALNTNSSSTLKQSTQVLGKSVGVQMDSGLSASQTSVETAISGTVLGQSKSLFRIDTSAATDMSTAENQVFVAGMQVASTQYSLAQAGQALNQFTVTIPPVKAGVSALTMPIGPLVVSVGAGFSLQGLIQGQISPTIIGNSAALSYVTAEVDPQIQSQAYAEGTVGLLVLRGGVKGDVTVADADLHINATLRFNKAPPVFHMSGYFDFLSGEISAFAEYFNILGWRWQSLWKSTLYKWAGICRDFDSQTQAGGKCAVTP